MCQEILVCTNKQTLLAHIDKSHSAYHNELTVWNICSVPVWMERSLGALGFGEATLRPSLFFESFEGCSFLFLLFLVFKVCVVEVFSCLLSLLQRFRFSAVLPNHADKLNVESATCNLLTLATAAEPGGDLIQPCMRPCAGRCPNLRTEA